MYLYGMKTILWLLLPDVLAKNLRSANEKHEYSIFNSLTSNFILKLSSKIKKLSKFNLAQ